MFDLEDHDAGHRNIWLAARVQMRLAGEALRAHFYGDQAPDALELSDPTLSNEAMLEQMRASMALDF